MRPGGRGTRAGGLARACQELCRRGPASAAACRCSSGPLRLPFLTTPPAPVRARTRYVNGRAVEEDKLNTIWIIDSNERPFYRAELWWAAPPTRPRCPLMRSAAPGCGAWAHGSTRRGSWARRRRRRRCRRRRCCRRAACSPPRPSGRRHQFHDGLGYGFPDSYKKVLKGEVAKAGRVGPTGCPEFPML
jgi:hypothetical protein